MSVRKYLVLLAVAIFGSSGNVCLARGMRDFGAVTSSNWQRLLTVFWSPWIVTGICLLILFFCSYLSALSWADLTYVLPATAISYVVTAFLAKLFLQENVTLWHWLGIGLITAGVGFVATGPSLTSEAQTSHDEERRPPRTSAVALTSGAKGDA